MIGCSSHIQQLAATNLYSKRHSHPLYFAAIRLYAASGLEFRRLLLFSHLIFVYQQKLAAFFLQIKQTLNWISRVHVNEI